MGNASAVSFLAFVLCLVACLSVSAAGENNDVAKKAVEAASGTINVLGVQAQWYIDNVNNLLQKVEPFKTNINEMNFQAGQTLFHGEQTAKENKEATAHVAKIKESSDTVSALHQSVTEELKNIVAKLNKLLSDAQNLKTECAKELPLIAGLTENHEQATQKAASLKTKGDELDKVMHETVKLMAGVDSAAENMMQNLKDSQVANYHVSVIVAVGNIDTMMKNADSITEQTQNTKEKLNKTVQEMKTLKTRATTEAIDHINNLCKTAEDELTKATSAVEKAKTEKEAMKQQKILADAALTNVQKLDKDVIKAKTEANTANKCFTTVEQKIVQLNNALQTVTTSLTTAKTLKQQMEKSLSTITTQTSTAQSKETEKSDPPLRVGKGPDRKDAAIQLTISVPFLIALIASAALQ